MQSIHNILEFSDLSSAKLLFSPSFGERQRISGGDAANYGDTADISPVPQFLLGQGLDLNNSTSSITSSTLDFHLVFESKDSERLTADGYFSEKTRKLEMSLSYQFQQEVIKDGIAEMRTFEANLSFRMENVESLSIKPFEQKEDIMDFVVRIMRKITDIVRDDDKILMGMILDEEDLKEIATMGDGELLELIQTLIQTAMFLAMMRRMMEGSEDQEMVILQPKREIYEGVEIELTRSFLSECSLEIRDITQQIAAEYEAEALEADTEEPVVAEAL